MGKIDLLKFMKPEKKQNYPGMTEQQLQILARIARTGATVTTDDNVVVGPLGPIKKTTMEDLKKSEHFIDLRKEKAMSDTPESDTQVVASMPEQHKLVTQELQEPKRMPPLKANEKQISIIVDLKLLNGDIDFMERLKLNLLSSINGIIANTPVHTKDSRGYTVNQVKLNTEIICR